jgi:hypothetical protein
MRLWLNLASSAIFTFLGIGLIGAARGWRLGRLFARPSDRPRVQLGVGLALVFWGLTGFVAAFT